MFQDASSRVANTLTRSRMPARGLFKTIALIPILVPFLLLLLALGVMLLWQRRRAGRPSMTSVR